MKTTCLVLLLLSFLSVYAQFDEPRADTLHRDTLTAWPDTSLAFADSTAPQHVPFHRGWLLPMGVIVLTCVGILMLFSARSR